MGYNETFGARQVKYKNERGAWKMFTGEARVAKQFDLCGEQWIKEPGKYYVGHNIVYKPDFYLPRLDLFVEVKNRNFNQIEEYDLLKMKLFYETGKDLLVIRRPLVDIKFAFDDYQESNGLFYSTKYIHRFNPGHVCILGEDDTGRMALKIVDEFDGTPFLDEAIEATEFEFEVIYE